MTVALLCMFYVFLDILRDYFYIQGSMKCKNLNKFLHFSELMK